MKISFSQRMLSYGLAITGLLLIFNLGTHTIKMISKDTDMRYIDPPPLQGQVSSATVSTTNSSGSDTAEVTDLAYADSSHVFRWRREHLKERCRRLEETSDLKELPASAWMSLLTVEAPGPLRICVPAKVGSTSWQKFAERLKNTSISDLHPATAMQVRHPFSRLTSAYRDKYLNGAPIGSYVSGWQNLTGSTTPWDFKWLHYWFPTLLSSGRVVATRRFFKLIEKDLMAFRYITKHYKMVGKGMALPEAKNTEFDAHTYNVATHMVANGRQVALESAAVQAYREEHANLIQRYGNATFTFTEFLQFIVWANELGVLDHHWTPYTDLCFPCQMDYEYILHLETVAEESQILLKDVGYPDDLRLTAEHRIKGLNKFLDVSDAEYFKDVPRSLLEKVVKIYENDFDLFGYSRDLSSS